MDETLTIQDESLKEFFSATGHNADSLKDMADQMGSTDILATMRYDPSFTSTTGSKVEISKHLVSTIDTTLQNELKVWFEEELRRPTIPYTQLLDNFKQLIDKTTLNLDTDLYEVFYYRFLLLGEQYIRLKIASFILNRKFNLTLKEFMSGLIDAIYNVENKNDMTYTSIEKMTYLLGRTNSYKMRVLLKPDNSLEYQAHLLGESPQFHEYFTNTLLSPLFELNSTINKDTWDIFIDTEPIEPSIFTSLKSTNRKHYTAARDRMEQIKNKLGITGKSEILVWNKDRILMEGSITNVAILKDDEKLITPSLQSGCLCGTIRHYLICKGVIEPAQIKIDELNEGQYILLFNGVMGVIKGRIRKNQP